MAKWMVSPSPWPLLLAIDPLAALAETQQALHERLKELVPTRPPELLAAWQAEAEAAMASLPVGGSVLHFREVVAKWQRQLLP